MSGYFSAKLLSRQLVPSQSCRSPSCPGAGGYSPQAEQPFFSLLEFHHIPISPSPVCQKSLWMAANPSDLSTTSPSLVSYANLWISHWVPLSRPLTMLWVCTGPRIDPWATPLVTGLQVDFVPLITILWAHQFTQFCSWLTVHVSSP